MTWEFSNASLTGGSLTLPIAPNSVQKQTAAVTKIINYPGNQPIILSMGEDTPKLEIKGIFAAPGKSANGLEDDYLTELNGIIGEVVTITAPDDRYDGDWILTEFRYTEQGGFTESFEYTMRLIQGHDHEVIS